ncbi:hypothetical protein, partial [Neisseria gonorrhoeae]
IRTITVIMKNRRRIRRRKEKIMALLNIEQGYNTTLHNRSPYLINFGLSCLIGLEKAAAAPRDVPRDNKCSAF